VNEYMNFMESIGMEPASLFYIAAKTSVAIEMSRVARCPFQQPKF
jgi:hypothetical protein